MEEVEVEEFGEDAIEWVATHLSHEAFLEDWVTVACRVFEAGRVAGLEERERRGDEAVKS